MARSSSIGGIFAELTLRDGKFRTGMKSAGAQLKAFGTSAVRYGAMAGAALGAGLAVGVKRTIDMGGELTDLSAQTGIAIDDLMRIQQAYKDNGKEASAAGKDINKMQKSIAAAAADPGGAADPFAKIGLSAEKLMAMNPTEQFYSIAAAIKSIQNPTERVARSMDIFGKGGGSLLAVFDGSDLESVNRSLGQMPEMMKEFSGELDHAGDLLGRLPNKADQFFTGFTAGVIGNIIPSLETIDGFEFTSIGKSLGDSLSAGIVTASSHLAVFSNAVAASLSGENFIDALNRYAAAQVAIEREDEAAAEERKRQREADAAYEKARLFEHRTAPDWIDPSITAPAAPKAAERMRAASMPEFDDYQRRGLSLSSTPQNQTEKKMLTTMEQVRDILKAASQNGQPLVWQA